MGSPMWARICEMGSGSVRNAIKVRGSWQVGQIRGEDQRFARSPGQEGGPSGWPGGGGVGCPRLSPLWLESRGRGGCRGRKRGLGSLSGQGVVLPGLVGDQRSQGSVGGKNAVVTVAVDAGWGEDLGQAVEELESGEAQGGTTCQVGLREQVEDLVGTTADQVKTVESERGPRTVADQPFEAGAVGGLDPDAGVEAEAATVLPVEHVLGLVSFQEAVAASVPQHPLSDRVLEASQELGGEAGGLVKTEAEFSLG